MRTRNTYMVVSLCCLSLVVGFTPASAADPPSTTPEEVMPIVEKMKTVFEPTVPRVAAVLSHNRWWRNPGPRFRKR